METVVLYDFDNNLIARVQVPTRKEGACIDITPEVLRYRKKYYYYNNEYDMYSEAVFYEVPS